MSRFVSILVFCASIAVSGQMGQQASAEDANPAQSPPCTCSSPAKPPSPWADRPKFADHQVELDENDEIAALEAIRVALAEVGDGSTYVWHRRHGNLSGLVKPTASFKDPAGRVCRHIVVIMVNGSHSGKAEGIACRLANGRWQLDG